MSAEPDPSRRPAALIVVPTLNEAAHIEALLTLLAAEAELVGAMIVVVDGGSSDDTVAIVAAFARTHDCVRLISNPARLQSAAVNLAVEEFGDDRSYLIRIDAHGGYPRDYCRALIREADRTGADAVVVPMLTVGVGAFQCAVASAQNSVLGNGAAAHRIGKGGRWIDHGHHALMRVAAFRAVGGYDSMFRSNEDAELDYRLRKAGFRIWLSGDTHMIYYPRAHPIALFRQYMAYGEGRASNLIKHRALPRIRQMLPLAIAPAAVLGLLAVFNLVALLPLLAWCALCLALGARALGRGQIYPVPAIVTPLVGVAAMIMQFAWSLGFWARLARSVRRGATNA